MTFTTVLIYAGSFIAVGCSILMLVGSWLKHRPYHYSERLAAFKARHPDYQPPYIKSGGRYVPNPRWVEGQFESYDSP